VKEVFQINPPSPIQLSKRLNILYSKVDEIGFSIVHIFLGSLNFHIFRIFAWSKKILMGKKIQKIFSNQKLPKIFPTPKTL